MLPPNPNKKIGFQFSFLEEKNDEPFLKQGSDLNTYFSGQLLNDLISISCNDFPGIPLEKTAIPMITKAVYDSIVKKKSDLCVVNNSEITIFVYTLCKVDTSILFLVSQIWTEISYDNKENWEEFYGIDSYSCCEHHYSQLIKNSRETNDSLVQVSCNLELIEKNCIFKKPYIKCNARVFSHFFNHENEDSVKIFNSSSFNIRVEPNFKFSRMPHEIVFCYGGVDVENFSSLTCDLLYDKISFENTNTQTSEHNFKNFISDSLHICFYYQKHIKCFPFHFFENEQRLLYLSINI